MQPEQEICAEKMPAINVGLIITRQVCDQVTWQTQFSTAFASILFYCRCPLRFTGVVPNPFYLMILFNLDTNLGPDTTPDSHSLANFIIFTAALSYWTCQILIL